MKQAKRPTRAQKIFMNDCGLKPAEWLVIEENADGLRLIRKADTSIEIVIRRRC